MLKIILLSICLHLSVGQFRECGSDCILLKDCPEMLKLARSRVRENFRKVREATCGFQNRAAKVCCPPAASVVPPDVHRASIPTADTSKGESLLPRRCGNPIVADRIFRGEQAPLGAYPWMAALGYIEQSGPKANGGILFHCGGALISEKYVLTAAHCLDEKDLGTKRLSVIHLGDWDLSNNPDCKHTNRGSRCAPPHIAAGFEEIIMHPKYNTRVATSDDIALIRLNVSIDFESTRAYVQPICLPPKGLTAKTVANGRLPIAAGWGITESGTISNILMRVNIPFADNKLCKEIYAGRFLENEQLCVGGTADQDTCAGDSGAPLMLSGPRGPPFLQIGIVSYGTLPCALNNVPAAYTSVSAYRDWILENLKP